MIVVAIIGILVAVGIPQYQNYVARAQVAEGFSLAGGLKTAVAEYHDTNGEFPASNELAGLEDKGTIKGKYVDTVEVGADGVITATFGDGSHTELKDHKLFLTPDKSGGGSITWACTGEEDIKAYLPSSCGVADSGPTAWSSLTSEEQAATTACWDQSVAESREDGNGYVEGPNTYTGSQQDVRQVATICGFGECRGCALCPFAVCDG